MLPLNHERGAELKLKRKEFLRKSIPSYFSNSEEAVAQKIGVIHLTKLDKSRAKEEIERLERSF